MILEKINKEINRLKSESILTKNDTSFILKIKPPQGQYFIYYLNAPRKLAFDNKYHLTIGSHKRFKISENTLERAYRKLYAILKNTKNCNGSFKDKRSKR